ncbi:MAG: voltage-gated sodium channel [Bacteroidia bacterium]|jgi:voltage-gated sodium channel
MSEFTASNVQARFDRLRSNKLFELIVVSIIVLSALLIGAKTYQLSPLTMKLLVVFDWAITLFFLLEISVRFMGEANKRRFFHSGWNVFDTLVVVVSLIPIEDSELALIGRLVRIFRVLRMVSIIPELRVLINSLLAALPQLGYVALMMFIIFYIYAAVGSTFFATINPTLWGDIAISMLTLFRVMTFEDWTDVMYETMVVYGWSWAYYLSFIFLSAFAFLNMIIGIVVNVLEAEHKKQAKDEAAEAGEPTLKELQTEIRQLSALLQERMPAR